MEFGGKGTHEDINSAPTYPMERFGLRAGARPLGGTHSQAPGFRVLPHSPTPTPTQAGSSVGTEAGVQRTTPPHNSMCL